MPTVTDILQNVAIYLGQSNVSALTINGFNAGLFALNQAQLYAQKAHDFKYAETNVFLSIPSTGGNYSAAYQNTFVTVTGTLSPNVAGSFLLTGVYNGLPFYTLTVSSVVYFLSYSGTAWTVTAGGFTLGSNYWFFTTASTNPSGAYTAHGSNTGVLTAAIATGAIGIKRVKYVALPIAGGDYEVVEFLTNDQFLSRVRMQTGRQYWFPQKSLAQLGVFQTNPLAYQNAQTIYVVGTAYPIVAQLNVVQWMPPYVNDADTDFITQYGSDFLMWQTVLEINKKFKYLTIRQEGDLEEASAQAEATAALQAFIEWDLGTEQGTSETPPLPPSQAPASAPAAAA